MLLRLIRRASSLPVSLKDLLREASSVCHGAILYAGRFADEENLSPVAKNVASSRHPRISMNMFPEPLCSGMYGICPL